MVDLPAPSARWRKNTGACGIDAALAENFAKLPDLLRQSKSPGANSKT